MTPNEYTLIDVIFGEKRKASKVVNFVNRKYQRHPRRWPLVLAAFVVIGIALAFAVNASAISWATCTNACNDTTLVSTTQGGSFTAKVRSKSLW